METPEEKSEEKFARANVQVLFSDWNIRTFPDVDAIEFWTAESVQIGRSFRLKHQNGVKKLLVLNVNHVASFVAEPVFEDDSNG